MSTAIWWIRRDLRLDDNPALHRALSAADRLMPVYIHAPNEEAPWQPGGASRWWLHQSLSALDARLRALGSRLLVLQGESLSTLRRLAQTTGADQCHWNRLYEPAIRARDTEIKQALRADGLHCDSHKAALLFEPWEIKTGADAPYRVFTPYWRSCTAAFPRLDAPLEAPDTLPPLPDGIEALNSLPIDALELLPGIHWYDGLTDNWQPGEQGAWQGFEAFLERALDGYQEQRDIPADPGTSRQGPHLHFGEISPRRLLAILHSRGLDTQEGPQAFIRELGWREFSHQLLYHFPQTPEQPLNPQFANFPWREDEAGTLLEAWQRGRTGIPIVDAGLRELWQTGWMHNRVRMITASLLTKNLRLPWQAGARWFWDTLVDADLANNTQGWQWTAGSGADAAPYFRIFNPVLQGQRFDPDGRYVRRWCPELAGLSNKLIHQPWEAKPAQLSQTGIRLGEHWPHPIVDLKHTRAEALAAYDQIKASAQ